MVRVAILFMLGTAASAGKLTAFKGKPRNQKNLLPVGLSNEALNLGLADTCSSFEKVCDLDFCIPSIGTCCSEGNGAYCEIGKRCVENGCCPVGETCTGPPTCEDGDEKICGTFCIPEGADCCDSTEGTFCDSPGTCTSSGCSVGSLRGGSGGSGGSGGGSGGSGGSGGTLEDECFDFQEKCGDGCIPKGSVCCPSGLEYCLSGQTCNNDGTCRRGGLGGGSGGSSSNDDDNDESDSLFTITSTSSTSTTSSETFGSNSLPTGLVSGGPDDEDSSNDSNDDAPRSGDDGNVNEPDAATMHGPSLFAAALALVPLLL
ncbi:hypothetical protein NLU13_7685 [Sarocladium strictum]|uniref:GPI anchored protein n=1 Tax=Sarocladium strictum TaxID=5046 RepID=A0AA39GD90_SARSR|nr:hypothetical protein NLU13_7685 [Sarocladium strictum]